MATINEVLSDLAACLCNQIEEDGNGKTCFCGVVPGQVVAADYHSEDCADDGCGVAWVRMGLLYPSTAVGQQNVALGNCGAGLGFDIEVGILRCIPVTEEPLGEAELLASSTLLVDDALTIRKAIKCCSSLGSKDYIMGPFTPIGPLGGLVGGAWTLFVGI